MRPAGPGTVAAAAPGPAPPAVPPGQRAADPLPPPTPPTAQAHGSTSYSPNASSRAGTYPCIGLLLFRSGRQTTGTVTRRSPLRTHRHEQTGHSAIRHAKTLHTASPHRSRTHQRTRSTGLARPYTVPAVAADLRDQPETASCTPTAPCTRPLPRRTPCKRGCTAAYFRKPIEGDASVDSDPR